MVDVGAPARVGGAVYGDARAAPCRLARAAAAIRGLRGVAARATGQPRAYGVARVLAAPAHGRPTGVDAADRAASPGGSELSRRAVRLRDRAAGGRCDPGHRPNERRDAVH